MNIVHAAMEHMLYSNKTGLYFVLLRGVLAKCNGEITQFVARGGHIPIDGRNVFDA